MTFIRKLAVLTTMAFAMAAGTAQAQLREVTNFGSNPGGLQMFEYVPADLPPGAGLVVMMHGCAQEADDVDDESGWIKLADTHKFALVFPQTKFVDPDGQLPCFRSYDPAHNRRGVGEALSVKQMTDWMIGNRGLARSRVFITGFSSGAHFTSVMMASYPDVFAAGAIMSGHPYGCANSYRQFVNCNLLANNKTPQQWGNLVRAAYPGYRGPYPRVSIWHGNLDIVVRESNASELVEQWTNVHGIDQDEDEFSLINGYRRYVYKTARAEPRVEHYRLSGQGHGIAINLFGPYQPTCGKLGFASQPSFICAPFYAAKWFGLAS
jgi:poly(hydroxyalkanoate) depolymerase family esterase